jgi:hypothetical protein
MEDPPVCLQVGVSDVLTSICMGSTEKVGYSCPERSKQGYVSSMNEQGANFCPNLYMIHKGLAQKGWMCQVVRLAVVQLARHTYRQVLGGGGGGGQSPVPPLSN